MPTLKTQYMGSNFVGPLAPNQVRGNAGALPQGPSSPGYVQGTANTVRTGTQAPVGIKAPAGIGGGGGSVLGTSTFGNAPMQEVPSSPGIDFDGLIAPALQALDESVAPLQQSYDTTVQGIEQTRGRRAAETQTNITGQENTLNQARTREQQEGESAANEARRQFSEIQQGLQSRYGGTTGTGAFASELAGRQTMKNIGNIRTQLSNAMVQIDDKLGQVKEIGRIALADIEDNALQEKSQAKNQLESALADIRRQKGELQSRKAEMAMQAMQQYQGLVADINARNTAFKQDLYVKQQAAEQRLQGALSKASQTAQGYSMQDWKSMGQQISPLIQQGLNTTISGNIAGGGKISIGTFKPQPAKEEDEDNFFKD